MNTESFSVGSFGGGVNSTGMFLGMYERGETCQVILFANPGAEKPEKEWRDHAMPLLTNDAVVLSFGWNTVGFGRRLGFEIEEIMLVCHGADHNDTICVAERRVQSGLFSSDSVEEYLGDI